MPPRPSTEPAIVAPPEDVPILPDDPRLASYRRHLSAEEFGGLYAWFTTFFPFQIEWLLDESRFAIANKSRQIGSSHTTAALLVLWAAFRGEPCLILSVGEDEAEEVLAKCKAHVRLLREFEVNVSVARPPSKEEIVFSSGGSITAVPSTGGRSFTGNLFLDEYAYHQRPQKVWDASAAVTTLGYRMRIVSTPNGAGNDFHQLWTNATNQPAHVPGKARWKTYEIPLSKAVDEGYPVDVDVCWAVLSKGDPRIFSQLFECSFLDNVLQYVPTEKIDACLWDKILEADDRGIYYAGLDIGREADLSVLTVVKVARGVADLVHVEHMKRTDSDGLEAMVAWAFKRYRLRRLCIDSTGLGTFPADRMKNKHGDRHDLAHRRNRVEAVQFGLKSKEALATNLYTVVTSKRVRLPASDAQLPAFARRNDDEKGQPTGPEIVVNPPGTAEVLRKEIASIQRVVTASGNVTYETPRTKDGHGDRAWSLALALYAVDKQHPMLAALQARMGIANR